MRRKLPKDAAWPVALDAYFTRITRSENSPWGCFKPEPLRHLLASGELKSFRRVVTWCNKGGMAGWLLNGQWQELGTTKWR